jgi:hypothetical protein
MILGTSTCDTAPLDELSCRQAHRPSRPTCRARRHGMIDRHDFWDRTLTCRVGSASSTSMRRTMSWHDCRFVDGYGGGAAGCAEPGAYIRAPVPGACAVDERGMERHHGGGRSCGAEAHRVRRGGGGRGGSRSRGRQRYGVRREQSWRRFSMRLSRDTQVGPLPTNSARSAALPIESARC